MMAYVNVTNRFLNQDKRYSEAVVMTCPAIIDEGSQRANIGPTYITSGDAWTAQTIESDTIIQKVYLIIDEAFPANTTISVDIAGTAYLTDVDGSVEDMTTSTTEDVLIKNPQTITVGVVNGPAGTEIQTGVARVVIETVHPSLKNGQYAAG
jgi:hypothetical protein